MRKEAIHSLHVISYFQSSTSFSFCACETFPTRGSAVGLEGSREKAILWGSHDCQALGAAALLCQWPLVLCAEVRQHAAVRLRLQGKNGFCCFPPFYTILILSLS